MLDILRIGLIGTSILSQEQVTNRSPILKKEDRYMIYQLYCHKDCYRINQLSCTSICAGNHIGSSALCCTTGNVMEIVNYILKKDRC